MRRSSDESAGDGVATVLDRMTDGFLALDADWTVTYANKQGRAFVGATLTADMESDAETGDADGDADADEDADFVGRRLWDAMPSAIDTTFSRQLREAMETQERAAFDTWVESLGAWFHVRVFPAESGVTVYLQDVTDRRSLDQGRQDGLNALQRLYAVSSKHELDFETKLARMLELGRSYLDLPNGIVTRIEGGTQYVDVAAASHPELEVGSSCPLDEAYCKRTVELEELFTVVNASDEGWEEDPAYHRFKLGTYIGGRVWVGEQLYGTVCFSGTEPRGRPFTDTERTFVELLSRWVSYELERERVRSRLERERDRLDRFAGIVSHDLRNPLHVATGRLELLRADVHGSEHIEPISEALDRMDELIEDVLMLARQGTTVGERTSVRLATVVESAWATVGTHDATLTVAVDDAQVVADEGRLKSLFENLFRNSVEHGSTSNRTAEPSGDSVEHGSTSVTVEIGLLEDSAGFYVADDGTGLSDIETDRLFEPGYTTNDAGTGFGLSIVREIVDAHGWEIEATTAETGGARFEVRGVDVE